MVHIHLTGIPLLRANSPILLALGVFLRARSRFMLHAKWLSISIIITRGFRRVHHGSAFKQFMGATYSYLEAPLLPMSHHTPRRPIFQAAYRIVGGLSVIGHRRRVRAGGRGNMVFVNRTLAAELRGSPDPPPTAGFALQSRICKRRFPWRPLGCE